MKTKLKVVLLLLVMTAGLFAWPAHTHAATGTVYLSPANSSVQIGNNTVVELRINPGTDINAVQGTINYDPSALQFMSSTAQSPFVCIQNSGGGGVVTVSCALLGSTVNTDTLITTVVFKSLVGAGSTNLSISGANAANNGSYTNPSVGSAHITLTTPPVSAPSTTSNNNTPVESKTTPNKTTIIKTPDTPLTVGSPTTFISSKQIHISAHTGRVSLNHASIVVKTDVAVPTYVEFGTDQNHLTQVTATSAVSKESTLEFPGVLEPGTTYYYNAVSMDATGFAVKTPVQSVSTLGYAFSVTVLDNTYRPLAHQKVTLHSTPQSATTDGKGVAHFTNVASGTHNLQYTINDKTYSQDVFVKNDLITKSGKLVAVSQSAAVVLAQYTQPKRLPWGLFVPVVLLIGGALIISARKSYALRRKYAFSKALASRYSIGQITKMEQYIHSMPSYDEDLNHLKRAKATKKH